MSDGNKPYKHRRSQLTAGASILQKLLERGNDDLSKQFLRWKLWRQWSEYTTPTIAQVSEPVSYHKGTLYVWVKNASWHQQLVFLRDQIRDQINTKLGTNYVKRIHFTMDRRSVPKDHEDRSQLTTDYDNLKEKIDQGDSEL